MKKIKVLIIVSILLNSSFIGYFGYIGFAYGVAEKKENTLNIDPNSELVKSLNLFYDPNFYSNTESYCLSFNFPNSNSIEEASRIIREEFEMFNPTADIIVIIGDEIHIASFDDFFEWMGFTRLKK